jgi:hypothetical protein
MSTFGDEMNVQTLEVQAESVRRQLKEAREDPHSLPNNIRVWEQALDYILTRIMERDYAKAHPHQSS